MLKILIVHPVADVRTELALSLLRQGHTVMVGATWPSNWTAWQPDLLITASDVAVVS